MSDESEPLDAAMADRVKAYHTVEARLKAEGMTDLWVGGAVRFEIRGYLPDKRYFYFGARGDRCGLKVWSAGPLEMDEDDWPKREPFFDEQMFPRPFPEMTFIDPADGEEYFRQLLKKVP